MGGKKRVLTIPLLKQEAREYAKKNSEKPLPKLFGASDGKAVGTYIEQGFRDHLKENYEFGSGNSASGIDLPSLNVDLKVTSIQQPQSSCPYKDANQKVYGLGYHLLIFVYEKVDDSKTRTAKMKFLHVIFIDAIKTGDYQTTSGILGILKRKGNIDDISAFLMERNLPLEEIGRRKLAETILKTPPSTGCLTISNALQWRLQYTRAIELADKGEFDEIQELIK